MSLTAKAVNIERGNRRIVEDATIAVDRGGMTALVGPNGAGKSTLLKALAGEYAVTNGEVSLDGRLVSELSARELARRRSVMAQASTIVFDFTVEEILELGWVQDQFRSNGQHRAATSQIVRECKIEHLMARTFNTLSGGEQQRVQFARCLLQVWQPREEIDTRYVLLDEPTSNLDLAHELMVLRLARRYAHRNTGVLVVLHDLNLAARFCNNIVIMFEGRVVANGDPVEVLEEELLSDVYATKIQVEWHETLERIVVHA